MLDCESSRRVSSVDVAACVFHVSEMWAWYELFIQLAVYYTFATHLFPSKNLHTYSTNQHAIASLFIVQLYK